MDFKYLKDDFDEYYLETNFGIFFFSSLKLIRVKGKKVVLLNNEGDLVFSSTGCEFSIKKVCQKSFF